MPMPRTSRASYKRHKYSGPRKSLKRIRGGLRKFYDENFSRRKAWRSEEPKNKPVNEEMAVDNYIDTTTQLRTYARKKPKIQSEATYSASSSSSVTYVPMIEPQKINWPQAVLETKSFPLTVKTVPDQCSERMKFTYYKHCIVPQCKSTTIRTPNKLFICVPNNKEIRQKWLNLARRDDVHSLSTHSRMYFCEDHFDLPNDMVNYIEYHIMGTVAQIRMKPDCIPSKFECQEDGREHTCSVIKQLFIPKKETTMTIGQCFKEISFPKDMSNTSTDIQTTEENVPEIVYEQIADLNFEVLPTDEVGSIAIQTGQSTEQALSLLYPPLEPFSTYPCKTEEPDLTYNSSAAEVSATSANPEMFLKSEPLEEVLLQILNENETVERPERQQDPLPAPAAPSPPEVPLPQPKRRRRRRVVHFERMPYSYLTLEHRRLRFEEERDKREHEREMERLKLESKKVEVARQHTVIMKSLLPLANNIAEFLKQCLTKNNKK